MKPTRFACGALVCGSAGTIASCRGSAMAAPAPRRKVRRGSVRLLMGDVGGDDDPGKPGRQQFHDQHRCREFGILQVRH
jgi:hypothetical protein